MGSEMETDKISKDELEKPVRYVKHVGPNRARLLSKLNISTVEDLLYHFPHRYLDLSNVYSIAEVKVGSWATVVGKVVEVQSKQAKNKRIRVLSVAICDGTGYLYGVWFNQDFLKKALREGIEVAFSGQVSYEFGKLQIKNPLFDILTDDTTIDDTVHTGRIIPIYPATSGLSTSILRRILREAVSSYAKVSDPLPTPLVKDYHFLDKSTSLEEIHFPTKKEFLDEARRRLLFEELFLLQVGLVLRKHRLGKSAKGVKHQIKNRLVKEFRKNLPFKLTTDQEKAIAEIEKDMASSHPMNRLLQGEVGSGKTVVALFALLTAVGSGSQGAIMSPTEVLAEQHSTKLKQFLEGLDVKLALLVGSTPEKEKKEIQEEIFQGKIDIVVGTHALIQEKVKFKELGLAVIDEQHRFGVRQRVRLKEKGLLADVLIMTATPIPRTFALTLYGDLDVSVIKELPHGREIGEQIKTAVCNQKHRNRAYQKIREEVKAGRQAYIVCPLIEESDDLEAKAVMEEAARLKNQVFPDLKVAFLHGRLKMPEKEAIMEDWRRGKIEVLISTTVIEVGIDVPNATVMLIEDAERFGLAQLHQLRGRVGRGRHQSYCILFADSTTDESRSRMEAIKTLNDGFKLAEADLEIRGEGQLFGPRQSGLPDLKLAKLTRDFEVLVQAREEAFKIVDEDNSLSLPEHSMLLNEVRKKFAGSIDWLFHS